MSTLRFVGLISGTSMDGIDAAAVEIEEGGHLQATLRAFLTVPYPPEVHARLHALCRGEEGRAVEQARLHSVVGALFAEAALRLLEVVGWDAATVRAIGSHGQTTVSEMRPDAQIAGYRAYATMQIGTPAAIAEATGITVVADFRARDIAAGGRGAPLVPYIDWLLYGGRGRPLALLNLGGIANLTLLPSTPDPGGVIGFDSGPANMPLDALVRLESNGATHYDAGGALAALGAVDEALLARLLTHPFFAQSPPKATGSEEFGASFVEALRRAVRLPPSDLLATLAELTARTVAEALHRYFPGGETPDAVLVSGGGVHNADLMRRLAAALAPIPVRPLPGDPDAKEAVAFAVLAYLTLRGLPGNLPGVTGAGHPCVLGSITPGGAGWDLLATR